jgi:hypothetical protein
MSFNLRNHVANKPIMDEPYLRHLRTSEVFDELREAREAYREAVDRKLIADGTWYHAGRRLEAAEAKAEIMAHLEAL